MKYGHTAAGWFEVRVVHSQGHFSSFRAELHRIAHQVEQYALQGRVRAHDRRNLRGAPDAQSQKVLRALPLVGGVGGLEHFAQHGGDVDGLEV